MSNDTVSVLLPFAKLAERWRTESEGARRQAQHARSDAGEVAMTMLADLMVQLADELDQTLAIARQEGADRG